MKSLEVAAALQRAFSDRESSHLRGERRIECFSYGDHRAILVMDLSVSRRILLSKSFSSFNNLQEGIQRSANSQCFFPNLEAFFDHNPLFLEGPRHHSVKLELKHLLDQQCADMESMLPRIERAIRKRSAGITSPLIFARLFTRLYLGIVISRLVSVPLSASARAVRTRQNVFYYHFHPLRQRRMDKVMARLEADATDSARARHDPAWQLAHSLLMMGYDAIVATSCAALVEGRGEDFTEAPARYCPVSFVSRICNHEATIDGHGFSPGDICFVSLAPAENEVDDPRRVPFGAGMHTCIGKRFSAAALAGAQEIAGRCFPDGFEQNPRAYGDGALLTFRHP